MADLWDGFDEFDDAGEVRLPTPSRAPAPRAAAAPADLWADFDGPAQRPAAPPSTTLRDNPRAILGSRAAAEEMAAGQQRLRANVERMIGAPVRPTPRQRLVAELGAELAPGNPNVQLTRSQQVAPGVFAQDLPAPTLGERVEDLGVGLRDSARNFTAGALGLPVDWINAVNRSANILADTAAGAFGQDAQDIPMQAQPDFVQYLRDQLPRTGVADAEAAASDQLLRERQELGGEDFLGTLGYVATHPTTLVDQLGQQAANIATAGVGRSVEGRLLAQGLSAGSQNVAQVEAELRARFPGMSDEEIAQRAADVFLLSLGAETILPNVIPGGTAVERALQREGRGTLTGILGGTLGEAVSGGGVEAVQQVGQNVALGDDPLQGVGQAAALGSLLDAGPGAVAGVSQLAADRLAARAVQQPTMAPEDVAELEARKAQIQPAADAGTASETELDELAAIDTALQADETARLANEEALATDPDAAAAAVADIFAGLPEAAEAAAEPITVEPRGTLGDEDATLPTIDDAVLGAFEGIEPPPAPVTNPAPAGTTAGGRAAPGPSAVGLTPASVAPATETAPPAPAPVPSSRAPALSFAAQDPELRRALGNKRAQGIAVATDVSVLPPEVVARIGGAQALEGAEGFYDPETGTAYVIEANLGKPSATGMSRAARKIWVAAHERTGHAGLRGAVQGKVGASLRQTLDTARANPTVQAIVAALASPTQGRSAAERGDTDVLHEEALAELAAATTTGNWQHLADRYGVTVPQAQRNTLRGLIARLLDGIREAFGLKGANDKAVFEILRGANRYARSGQVPGERLVDDPDLYFRGEGRVIPMDKVEVGKGTRPTSFSAARAAMREAASKQRARRAPIEVEENADGTFTVTDGNATTAVAKDEGLTKILAKVSPGATLQTRDRLEQIEDLEATPTEQRKLAEQYAAAGAIKAEFDRQVRDLADVGGGRAKAVVAPLKGVNRALEKLREGGPGYRLGDLVRATITVNDLGDVPAMVERIRAAFGDRIVKFKDGLSPGTPPRNDAGYRDINLVVEYPNGAKAELQVSVPEMVAAKNGPGHALYEQSRQYESRELTAAEGTEYEDLLDQQRKVYGEAWERAQSRAASRSATSARKVASSSAPSVSSRTSTGVGTSEPVAALAKPLPGTSTSGMPSQSKNRVPVGKEAGSAIGRAPVSGASVTGDGRRGPLASRAGDVTTTPAFRRWFGDSKVVDDDGNPLVVYHGSPQRGITAFDMARSGERTDYGNVGIGVYTSPKRYLAAAYAKRPMSRTASDDIEGEVLPLYLSIQNPLRVIYDERYQERIEQVARDLGVDDDPKWRGGGPSNRAFAENFTSAAKAAGYDGALTTGSDGEIIEAVAYSPEQIKSATANAGTFDASNPSILASRAPDVRRSYDVDASPGWRDRVRSDLRETFDDLANLRSAARKPKQILAAVNRLRSLVFDSAQSRARDLEAQFPESKALRELFDIYFEAPGHNRLVAETLPSAIEARRNVFLARVERHLETNGLAMGKMSKAQNRQLRNALLGVGLESIPGPIRSAAELIRQEMTAQREDALAAGVDIGEVTDIGYLTRLYDDDKILGNEAAFLRDAAAHMERFEFIKDVGKPKDVLYGDGTFARFIAALRRAAANDPSLQGQLDLLRDLAKSYRNSSNVRGEAEQMKQIVLDIYPKVARDYAKRRAQTWLHAIKTPDISRGFNGLMESGAPVTRERTLVGAADITLQDWMKTDVREILNAYANSIAGKVEEARRVGTDPSYLKGLFDRAIDEGVSSEGLDAAADILGSVTGSRVSTNATFQGFQEAASAWTYLALLGRGLFASIAEPATFAIRTGQLRHVLAPLIIAGRSIARVTGNDTNRALQRLAVDIGVNGHRAVEDTLLNGTGGDFTSRFWRGNVTKFFRGIWLTQLTEAQRAYGVGASVGYLKALARQLQAGDETAAVYLNELGIADQADFADWILQQGARPAPTELFDENGRPTPRGNDFMVAARRLVNQSIQNVQPQHRAQWMNSPGGRIFASIMGYSMAAYTNVLKREFTLSNTLRKEIGSGAAGRRAAVFAAAAAGLYVNVLIVSTLREALFNQARFEDKDDEDILKELAQLAATRTFGLGTADPLLQLYSNLKYKKTFAETLAGATLGTFLGDAQKVAEVFNPETNSPNTDTTEFRAAEAIYRSVVAPIANLALSRIPFVSGVAIPAVSGSNVRKWFAGLFFDTPEPRTQLDDDYTQATKQVQQAKRKLEEDLATFPKAQWATELRRIKAEFPTVLAGARLDVYAPTPSNLAAGRIGPKADQDGKPKIVFGRRGKDDPSLYGELEGYPQRDPKTRRWVTGEGLADQVENANRAINQIRNGKEMTLGQLYKTALASGAGDKVVGELGRRIQQNPDGPAAAKLAGERLRREVLDELMASRRVMKRATIRLVERAQQGQPIARGAGVDEVTALRMQ